ncbi:hypothetical protein SASPL_149563 [Salvia splendens]|uniref:Peptidase S54 rhomboid domain-containing protein n=1 Tax=Salvia splendens TaxID=180675 RepID=A0A8X8WCF3_SALSN|nr:hypothetical protein SASPL_149563 [Salvia splendens]
MCSPNGVRVRGTIHSGAFPSSLLARRVFSNALLQGRHRFPVKHCSRRSFSSFSLYHRLCLDILGLACARRRLTTNGVVLGLMVTNVAVFILWRVAGIAFMVKNFTISVDNILSGRLHTLITNAFSHINQLHIISNMITLYFFGTAIDKRGFPHSMAPALGVLIIGKDILRVLLGDREVAGSAHLGGAAVATVAWLQKRKDALVDSEISNSL